MELEEAIAMQPLNPGANADIPAKKLKVNWSTLDEAAAETPAALCELGAIKPSILKVRRAQQQRQGQQADDRASLSSSGSTTSLNEPAVDSTADSTVTEIAAWHGRFWEMLQWSNRSERDLKGSLRKLRMAILRDGLPPGADHFPQPHAASLRGCVWKVLLGLYRSPAAEYLALVQRGPSPVYAKIKNDAFRTLTTDRAFGERVSEDMLVRVLNAFALKMVDAPPSRLLNLSFSYVQGMNVLVAPMLYVLPELDAFHLFAHFIRQHCPLYVQPALEGVHFGLKLLDRCLRAVDPVLFRHLESHGLGAKLYAMPSLLTFSACTPPLTELVKLWDFYFAFGLHLNVIGVIAQLQRIRGTLLASASPMKELRTLPPLHAQSIITRILGLVNLLPDSLYDMLVRHMYDPTIDASLQNLELED